MDVALRPLLGVLFGVLGILFWIGGMVVLSWYVDNKVEDDRQT